MRRPPDALKSGLPGDVTNASGKRVRNNFLKLLGGRGWSALLALAATSMMARALTPHNFGVVIMVHSFLLMMQGLVKLSSFEAIIRFGVPYQEVGDNPRLAQLMRITFVSDIIAALTGTLLASLIVPLLGPRLGWEAQTTHFAALYSLLLLSGLTGTANGALRLYDRFDVLGGQEVVGPLVRLAGVSLCWLLGLHDIGSFLLATGASWLAQNIYVLVAGWRERRRHLPDERLFKGDIWHQHRERFPGLWRFLNVVYWQSNLDLIPKHVSVLAAGFFLGPTTAGLFRLARQYSGALAVPALLLRKVLLADLARLWHRRDPMFAKVLFRALAASAGAGLLIAMLTWFFALPLLTLLAGSAYHGAAPAMTWLMLAAGLDMGVSTLRAASYAMGHAHSVLKITALALIAYIVIFPLLTQALGLAGAGMASAATSFLTLAAMSYLVRRQLKTL